MTNQTFTIGSIVSSLKFGNAEVIEIKGQRMVVRFLNTGNIKEIHKVAAYNGMFSDTEEKKRLKQVALDEAHEKRVKRRMSPSVQGVGYLGMGPYKATSPFYRVWADMMRRCYDTKFQERYPTYVGCTVCERWHNFQTFCEDFPLIDNFQLWKEEKADLDKDTKVYGNKIYSLETCRFITHEENTREAMVRKWAPDGSMYGGWEGQDELRQYALTAQARSQEAR